jgi:hypothetical protein
MKFRVAVLALAAVATGASAETVLWQNVEAGMSAEQIQALYPAGDKVKHKRKATEVEDVQVGECEGNVTISHPQGVVTGVEIVGGGCAGRVFASLVGRYGEPQSQDIATDDANEMFTDKTRVAVWREGGRLIRYRGDTNGIMSSWRLRYTPINDAGL